MKSKLEMLNNEGCEVYNTRAINMSLVFLIQYYNDQTSASEYLDMLLRV